MGRATVVGKKIVLALENFVNGDYEEALLHTSIALDITSKREYSKERSVGARFKKFLNQQLNMNIITGVMTGGMPVAGLLLPFNHPGIATSTGKTGNAVAIEDILYHAIRCSIAHDGALPDNLKITNELKIVPEKPPDPCILPHTIILGLIMAVVGSPKNAKESLGDVKGQAVTVGSQTRYWIVRNWVVESTWGKRDQIHKDVMNSQQVVVK